MITTVAVAVAMAVTMTFAFGAKKVNEASDTRRVNVRGAAVVEDADEQIAQRVQVVDAVMYAEEV